MNVTKEQIIKIMPNAKNRVATYIGYINTYIREFEINTPLRLAHYLAQIAVESGELRYTEELASGAAYDTGRKAVALGNTPEKDGDGQKYKGRGLLQLTGRSNYAAYKRYCGFDVVQKPQLLARPLGAVRSSMWYWKTHGLNELADADDITLITRRINGGLNGFERRKQYLERAKEALGL